MKSIGCGAVLVLITKLGVVLTAPIDILGQAATETRLEADEGQVPTQRKPTFATEYEVALGSEKASKALATEYEWKENKGSTCSETYEYANYKWGFSTKAKAKAECIKDEECSGVSEWKATVRNKGWKLCKLPFSTGTSGKGIAYEKKFNGGKNGVYLPNGEFVGDEHLVTFDEDFLSWLESNTGKPEGPASTSPKVDAKYLNEYVPPGSKTGKPEGPASTSPKVDAKYLNEYVPPGSKTGKPEGPASRPSGTGTVDPKYLNEFVPPGSKTGKPEGPASTSPKVDAKYLNEYVPPGSKTGLPEGPASRPSGTGTVDPKYLVNYEHVDAMVAWGENTGSECSETYEYADYKWGFSTEAKAKAECIKDEECSGVSEWKATVRNKGWKLCKLPFSTKTSAKGIAHRKLPIQI